MAIATNGGHISRAIDFSNSPGKYFIIGGEKKVWDDETNPPSPAVTDYKLYDVVGLKKVDKTHLVVPDEAGSIAYKDQNWRIVSEKIETTVGSSGVTKNSTVVTVSDLQALAVGSKIRINDTYEGKIKSISGLSITLDTPAPVDIPAHSPILGGALVEGAKYVYVECYLEYDEFPLVTYRQVGLCTGVTPNTSNIMRAAGQDGVTTNEWTSLGVLEILDNKVPSTRNINQREMLSLIIEF